MIQTTRTEPEALTDLRTSSIAAVLRCIDRGGYEDLDVRTIAREADYSPAALYSVAQNKAQLLIEAERELISSLHRNLPDPSAFADGAAVLSALAGWWRDHPQVGAFACSTARTHVPIALSQEWRVALAQWCRLPLDQSDDWWDEFTVIVRATLGNLALSNPAGTPTIIESQGQDLLRFAAGVMVDEVGQVPESIAAWLQANPPRLQLEDPLLCALAETTSVAEVAQEITVAQIAAAARVSVSSVYRSGGPTVLKQRLLDAVTRCCVQDLEGLSCVADRLVAMSVRCTSVGQSNPVMFEFWRHVEPAQAEGPGRSSWIQGWFNGQVESAQRNGELRGGAGDIANILAALTLAPSHVWAGQPGDRGKILPWLLSMIHAAFARD